MEAYFACRIQIRPSMQKFESVANTIEVVGETSLLTPKSVHRKDTNLGDTALEYDASHR